MTKTKNIFNEADETALPSSDDEQDATDSFIQDDDTCNAYELDQSFQQKYKIADESAVTLQKDYILKLCSDSAFSYVAAGLSNGTVQVFQMNEQRGLTHAAETIPALQSGSTNNVNVCGVRFLDETANSLLIGTSNGLVRLFDLRSNKEQARFEDTTDSTAKSITAFDCNANGRVICAGTEKIQNNVYLLFYDVRQQKQLGGYFDSHEDDVTTLSFHGTNPDILCSGSTDGLINIFNIAETTEDDALLTTINTESSVHKLNWHKNIDEKDIISCITHTNDFKAYESAEGDELGAFNRETITAAVKRKASANCNLIASHNMADGSVFLLTGSNLNKGEVMRSVKLQNAQLVPLADFEGNKQIVRESVFDSKTNALITAGESGIVTLWTPATANNTAGSSANKLKTKSKLKNKKNTPY